VLYVPFEYPTIEAAVTAACDGAEIIVAPGIYDEIINFAGKAIALRSASGPEVTVLDGQEDSRLVIVANAETPQAMLEGFTIRNGRASQGGGMYIRGSSPTVSQCTFADNAVGTYGKGGGIFTDDSQARILDCVFAGNSGRAGGGIFATSSDITIIGCSFIYNRADGSGDYGGGIAAWHSTASITNCTFEGNDADQHGGGLAVKHGTVRLTGCTFEANTAGDGGGLHAKYSALTLTHCSIMSLVTRVMRFPSQIAPQPS
jgi:hypothetical protein